MAPLRNQRHENFCLLYIAGTDPAEAYGKAFKCKSPRHTLSTNACRLMRDKKVSTRIDELRVGVAEVVVEKVGIDDARVIEEIAKLAFSDFDPKSVTVRDKLGALKILEERTRLTRDAEEHGKSSGFIDAPPRETWEQWLERERLDGHGSRALAAPARPTNGGVSGDVD